MFWLVLSVLVLAASVVFAFWSIRKEVEMSKALGERHPEPGPHPIIPPLDNQAETQNTPPQAQAPAAFSLEEGPRRQAEPTPPFVSQPNPPVPTQEVREQVAQPVVQDLPSTPEYQQASDLITARNEQKGLQGQIDLQNKR